MATPEHPHLVRTDELERQLEIVAAGVHEPVEGIFGSASEMWKVNRHAAIFLGSGRAALLQIAHPQVAQGIAEHSRTKTDPRGRFQRTFRQIFPMVWGDLDSALNAARHVHRVHQAIHGTFDETVGAYSPGDRYDANDRRGLVWVHATLWESSIAMYETFYAPLSDETKESYYQETRVFARLFGLADGDVPHSWSDFQAYNQEMWNSEELAIGKAAREIAAYLFVPSDPLFAPLMVGLRTLTIGLLPAAVRDKFGFAYGEKERRAAARATDVIRRVLPHLPKRLRYQPPYFQAMRRLSGRSSPDPLAEILNRAYLGSG